MENQYAARELAQLTHAATNEASAADCLSSGLHAFTL
jgi:hypothetical protein